MLIGAVALLGALAIWAAGSIAGRRALAALDRNAHASAALHNAVLRSELDKFRLVPTALAGDPEARAQRASWSDFARLSERSKAERVPREPRRPSIAGDPERSEGRRSGGDSLPTFWSLRK